jgi:hypothetical protein
MAAAAELSRSTWASIGGTFRLPRGVSRSLSPSPVASYKFALQYPSRTYECAILNTQAPSAPNCTSAMFLIFISMKTKFMRSVAQSAI